MPLPISMRCRKSMYLKMAQGKSTLQSTGIGDRQRLSVDNASYPISHQHSSQRTGACNVHLTTHSRGSSSQTRRTYRTVRNSGPDQTRPYAIKPPACVVPFFPEYTRTPLRLLPDSSEVVHRMTCAATPPRKKWTQDPAARVPPQRRRTAQLVMA